MDNNQNSTPGASSAIIIGPHTAADKEAGCCETAASTAKALAHEVAIDSHFDTRIDTWVTGVVIKLDTMGTSFTVSGHRMPYATVHAGMVNETASKTVGLSQSERLEKETEVRLSWQEKLTEASVEDCPVDVEITCRIPVEGQLRVVTEESLPRLDFVHHEKGMAVLSTEGAGPWTMTPRGSRRNDQEDAEAAIDDPVKSSEELQSEALGAFARLTIGQSVYVGYASGVFNNEAHSVIKRLGLHPTEPASSAVAF